MQGVQAHPKKLLFVENPGKIPEKLGEIPENLGKIPKNPGKDGAQCCLISNCGKTN